MMGDMFEFLMEQAGFKELDELGALTVCPVCGNVNCFVGTDHSVYCELCGYIS